MPSKNRYCGIDSEVVKLARRKARKLVGSYGFTTHDHEDLEQILVVHVIEDLGSAKDLPNRGACIERSLRDCVSNLIRKAKAQKRGLGSVHLSFDSEATEGCCPLEEAVSAGFYRENRQLSRLLRTLHESGLNAEERRLCELLIRHSLVESAREMGLSRWKARQVLERIRRKLA